MSSMKITELKLSESLFRNTLKNKLIILLFLLKLEPTTGNFNLKTVYLLNDFISFLFLSKVYFKLNYISTFQSIQIIEFRN